MKLTGRGRVPEKGNTVFIFPLLGNSLRSFTHIQRRTGKHTHVLVLDSRRFVFLFVYLSMFFRIMLNARREVSNETLFIYKSYRITLFSNVSV